MRINKTILSALTVVAGLFIVYAYVNVIVRPFPFLNVIYTRDVTAFNAPPASHAVNMKMSFQKSDFSGLAPDRLKSLQGQDLLSAIRAATRETRHLQSLRPGEKIRNAHDIFSSEQGYQSSCSESAKIFTTLMQVIGVPSRVIWMQGHTTSEVWDGDSWIVVDAHGNMMAQDRRGSYAGLIEVAGDFDAMQLERIVPETASGPSILPNFLTAQGQIKAGVKEAFAQNLFVVMDVQDMLSYHENTRDVSKILHAGLVPGSVAVGRGMQLLKPESKKAGNFGINLYKRFLQC